MSTLPQIKIRPVPAQSPRMRLPPIEEHIQEPKEKAPIQIMTPTRTPAKVTPRAPIKPFEKVITIRPVPVQSPRMQLPPIETYEEAPKKLPERPPAPIPVIRKTPARTPAKRTPAKPSALPIYGRVVNPPIVTRENIYLVEDTMRKFLPNQ